MNIADVYTFSFPNGVLYNQKLDIATIYLHPKYILPISRLRFLNYYVWKLE